MDCLVVLVVEYPESLSRDRVLPKRFFEQCYVGIPHGSVLYFYDFYEIAVAITTFIAFFAIPFTGKYPKVMYDFVFSSLRWYLDVTTYLSLLRDEYPLFDGSEQRQQGSNKISFKRVDPLA